MRNEEGPGGKVPAEEEEEGEEDLGALPYEFWEDLLGAHNYGPL